MQAAPVATTLDYGHDGNLRSAAADFKLIGACQSGYNDRKQIRHGTRLAMFAAIE